MGSDDAQEAAQTVQRLNHGREQSGITAIAGKNLADRELEPADKLLGLLAFLIGHVRSPSARSKPLHAGKYTTSAKTYQILPARAVGARQFGRRRATGGADADRSEDCVQPA